MKSIIMFAVLTMLATNVFAIDADMWENVFRVKTGMTKGMKATAMLESVLNDVIKDKKIAKVEYNKATNEATVTFKKPYKDIISLKAFQRPKDNSIIFNLIFTFNPNSMLLLDILGRYGDLCEIETDAEMGRVINVMIDKNTKFSSGHPLRLLTLGLKDNELILLRFTGPDRVHVTELIYGYVMNDKKEEE